MFWAGSVVLNSQAATKDTQLILEENGLKQVKDNTAFHIPSGAFQGHKGTREVYGQLEGKRDILLVSLIQQLGVLQVHCRRWPHRHPLHGPLQGLC